MMPRMLFILAAVIALSCPSAARASDAESVYLYWGLGYASHTYPDEMHDSLDELSNLSFALDTFGFYFPQGDRTLVGGIINASADLYYDGPYDFSFFHYLYGLSAMRFLTHQIGQGLFVRADVGLARTVLYVDEEKGSDWGPGFLLGGGYGIPVTSSMRLLANANVSLRRIEGDQYTTVGIMLNGLF